MERHHRLAVFAAALWWGSLSGLGALVVPLLFKHLPSPALAGATAAQLFGAQTWVAVGCGLALLLIFKSNQALAPDGIARTAIIFIVLGLLCALLAQFAVAPRIVARDNLRLWHGIGTALYVAQWAAAGAALWMLAGRSSRSTP